MTFVSLGLVFVMIGIVGLLLPYYPISGTLNNGPPRTYAKGGNSYQVDDTIWIVAAVCFVVCALLLRIGKGAVREAVPHLTAMMMMQAATALLTEAGHCTSGCRPRKVHPGRGSKPSCTQHFFSLRFPGSSLRHWRGPSRQLDDQHRNTNMKNKDHLV